MKATLALLIPLLAFPGAVLAQVSHSQARIAPAFPVVQSELAACLDRRDSLVDRKVFLDLEKAGIDRAAAAIEDEGAWLAQEIKRLDNRDLAAVAAYNARSEGHNVRVAAHNRRVAEMNSAASMFNGDAADMTAYCNWRASRPYTALR